MRRAFTLIELLVVIAIISSLAAILFPVFAQAKESAKKISCLSGTKQIGIGLYMYVSDVDDTLPMANYPAAPAYIGPPFTVFAWHAGAGVAELSWADLLLPYTKNIQIFKCPDDNVPVVVGGVPLPGAKLSYALNYYAYRQPGGVSNFSISGGSMTQIPAPANKIFITETGPDSTGNVREIVRPDRDAGLHRHLAGANYVMEDTHAKYHVEPKWWATVPSSVWGTPENAQLQPCPQWFPWLDTTDEKW